MPQLNFKFEVSEGCSICTGMALLHVSKFCTTMHPFVETCMGDMCGLYYTISIM